MTKNPFLTLPPELRNKIYREYFVVEGGYTLDFEAQKLTAANGDRIHLGLLSTCKFIVQEAEPIPFGVNTITFSTVYTKKTCYYAGLLQNGLKLIHDRLEGDFDSTQRLLTPDICSEVIRKFPRAASTLENVLHPHLERLGGLCNTFQPYYDREAIFYAIQCLVHKHGMKYVHEVNHSRRCVSDPLKIVDLSRVSWAFPTEAHLHRIAREFGNPASICPHNGRQYRFTAASVAIRFLDSIPATTRLRMRNILLREDRRAGCFQECHAQGLIPFCQENPRLRIESRVSLWRTIFQKPEMDRIDYVWSEVCGSSFCSETRENLTENLTKNLGKTLKPWLLEALALLDDGMPPDSFTLVLDGDPAPDFANEIFQTVIFRDIAWSEAFKEAYARNILPRPECHVDGDESFLRLMRHLVNKTSILRCNFDTGEFWDVEKLIEQAHGWDSKRWSHNFLRRQPRVLETGPRLPEWCDLLLENFDPQWREFWSQNA